MNGMNRDQLLIDRKRLKEKQNSLGGWMHGADHQTPAPVRFSAVYDRTCYERRRGQ